MGARPESEIGRAAAWLLALLVAAAAPASAQLGAGAVAGAIADPAGVALPAATVTITASSTNGTRAIVTDEQRHYVVTGLPPGTYRVQVALDGFRSVVREGVRLANGETI